MPLRFVEPATVAEASAILRAEPDSKVISGGTAVVLMLRQRLIDPSILVSLSQIPGLARMSLVDKWLRIGALTSLQDIAEGAESRMYASGLADACGHVGNVRVRNRATIGGNVAEADYASDPPAVLVSLGARVCAETADAPPRHIPAADFFADYYTTTLATDEIVTSVEIPIVTGRRSVYQKFRSRSSEDRPCVGVAASACFNASGLVSALEVVVGAVAATPQRLSPSVTQSVIGSRLGGDVIATIAAEASRAIKPIGDARGSSWYRSQIIEVMVRSALSGLTQ